MGNLSKRPPTPRPHEPRACISWSGDHWAREWAHLEGPHRLRPNPGAEGRLPEQRRGDIRGSVSLRVGGVFAAGGRQPAHTSATCCEREGPAGGRTSGWRPQCGDGSEMGSGDCPEFLLAFSYKQKKEMVCVWLAGKLYLANRNRGATLMSFYGHCQPTVINM